MQYVEDDRMYFWSTINREETEFMVDMSQDNIGAKMECVIMSGVLKGETRLFPRLSLETLWEQQQEVEEE